MKKGIFFSLLLLLTGALQAQEIRGGFRAGLNFSTINGPLETNSNGDALEEFAMTTGFHIGAVVNFQFTDYFGLRSELSYSQRGTDYRYEGESFWNFETADRSEFISTGSRSVVMTISNSYLTIPVSAYVRVDRFELSGGAGFGLNLAGRGSGELTYRGISPKGNEIEEFTTALDFNYGNDHFGRSDFREDVPQIVDGVTILAPKNMGAYYEAPSGKKNLFKPYDFFLHAGLSIFLNRGMYIGGRINYGMTDITRTVRDVSKFMLDPENGYILREDKDQNLNIEASIGFSF
jgi:hypothetical protein